MSTALRHMTVDEFLLWAEGREGRWELHDGAPVQLRGGGPFMMAPERAAHVRTKFRAATALQAAIEQVLQENPDMLASYRAGKTNVGKAMMGKAMAATRGKANPEKLAELLERALADNQPEK